jgi:hypothetical protein
MSARQSITGCCGADTEGTTVQETEIMPKTIVLVETRNGCAIMEKEPRYDVLLHGKKVGQLYFNVRGYVGTLPTPRGTHLCIGERGISDYRKAVAQLNREWAEAAK